MVYIFRACLQSLLEENWGRCNSFLGIWKNFIWSWKAQFTVILMILFLSWSIALAWRRYSSMWVEFSSWSIVLTPITTFLEYINRTNHYNLMVDNKSLQLKDFCFVRGPYWELHNRQSFQKYSASFDCLKFIKLPGFKFQKDELMLVKFFLERAIFLEKLVLVTPKSRHARVLTPNLQAYYQYLQSWKASPGAQIAVFEHLNDTSVCPMHSKTWY